MLMTIPVHLLYTLHCSVIGLPFPYVQKLEFQMCILIKEAFVWQFVEGPGIYKKTFTGRCVILKKSHVKRQETGDQVRQRSTAVLYCTVDHVDNPSLRYSSTTYIQQ